MRVPGRAPALPPAHLRLPCEMAQPPLRPWERPGPGRWWLGLPSSHRGHPGGTWLPSSSWPSTAFPIPKQAVGSWPTCGKLIYSSTQSCALQLLRFTLPVILPPPPACPPTRTLRPGMLCGWGSRRRAEGQEVGGGGPEAAQDSPGSLVRAEAPERPAPSAPCESARAMERPLLQTPAGTGLVSGWHRSALFCPCTPISRIPPVRRWQPCAELGPSATTLW